jgi:hypothetical protein
MFVQGCVCSGVSLGVGDVGLAAASAGKAGSLAACVQYHPQPSDTVCMQGCVSAKVYVQGRVCRGVFAGLGHRLSVYTRVCGRPLGGVCTDGCLPA